MTLNPFSPEKYLFVMTLTVRIKQCEKVNLFKSNTIQMLKHRFMPHSPYYPTAYIRTPLNKQPGGVVGGVFGKSHVGVSFFTRVNVCLGNGLWKEVG